MDPVLSALYTRKSEEYSTLKRVYCANPRCSQFLGPQRAHFSNIYTCSGPRCNARTCSRCRKEVKAQGSHNCLVDGADKELLTLSKKSGWAQCPGCTRMIELTTGCFHMTCRCKTQVTHTYSLSLPILKILQPSSAICALLLGRYASAPGGTNIG